MKLIIVILVAGLVSDLCWSEATHTDKELARTSKGLYGTPKIVDNRNIFRPRMEYDEWTPLGRGDPLKNDPTYDYVPPVLERVHYWMEPSKRTPDPPVLNSGLLILGSARTEPTFTMRGTTQKYQGIPVKEPQADSRLDTMSLLDPFLKLMDVSKFGINLNPSTMNNYKPAQSPNRVLPMNYQRPVHHQQYNNQRYQQPQALQRPPYTMLVPPPPPSPTPTSVMTFATVVTTTESPKTHSVHSTISPSQTTTTTGTMTESMTTQTIIHNQDINITTIYPTTILANTENLYKPVAIAMPEENDTIRSDMESLESTKAKPEEVLPVASLYNKEKEKNHSSNKEFGHNKGTLPAPASQHKRPMSEQFIRPKEPYKYRPLNVLNEPSDNNLKEYNMMTPPLKNIKTGDKHQTGSRWGADNRATTVRPVTTTRAVNILTTDPLFKHYKQPSEPIKGPLYLIIQGHSKVKTYGASKNPINGLLTSNEIREEAEERKDRYGELYDLSTPELKNRDRGKSLDWYQNVNHLRDEERRKRFNGSNVKTPAISELRLFDGAGDIENLEETFGKSEGGSSKKRYLVNDMINDTFDRSETVIYRNRQLLSEESKAQTSSPTMITVKQQTTTTSSIPSDNYDIESFIALNDDYTPEDVVSLLLKEEGQGSGFGNFVVSLFSRSIKDKDSEETR